ncbi:MAG TPA: hypothetical protein VMU56_08275 [Beijerinckiaceae bacterium]|nr:hypothetical protein [Beijerinckiaceae bacterium]
MTKLLTMIACTVGLLIAAIAVGGGFSAAPVQAHEETAAVVCPAMPVHLDEGYGVSRTVMRPVCAPAR